MAVNPRNGGVISQGCIRATLCPGLPARSVLVSYWLAVKGTPGDCARRIGFSTAVMRLKRRLSPFNSPEDLIHRIGIAAEDFFSSGRINYEVGNSSSTDFH